jgi:DNA-directed RNA polymerase alpha subunit
VDGVKETALQIMLNFKELKFSADLQEKIEWRTKKFK